MFGRATITLGIGPHSSFYITCCVAAVYSLFSFSLRLSGEHICIQCFDTVG